MMLSVVVPCYNEEAVLREAHRRLVAALGRLDFELVYVNDGSRDTTLEILRELQAADGRVRVVGLSRNFGHQIAVTAGLERASGDAVVIIDADLQDPPEVIPEMVERWRDGYDVVYGLRTERAGETSFKLWTAKAFYRLLNRLSDVEIPLDAGDFRLMDRKVVAALLSMPERDRYLRGMVSWVGFRQVAVMYQRAPRLAGDSKYPILKMINFAADGIISFSFFPLRLAVWTGFAVVGLVLALIVFAVVLRLYTHDWVRGWASLFVAILFMSGVQLVFLGIIGEYIGRIYNQTKQRPLYFVQEQLGFGDEPRDTTRRTAGGDSRLERRDSRRGEDASQVREAGVRLPETPTEFDTKSRFIREQRRVIEEKERLIQSYVKTVEDFGRSPSYRLGRALTWPLRAVRQGLGMASNGDHPSLPLPTVTTAPAKIADALEPQTDAETYSDLDAAYDYSLWVKLYDTLTDSDRQAIQRRIEGLESRPSISVVLAVCNVEERHLRQTVESVRRQLYPFWELCVAADDSTEPHVRRVLEEYAATDARIKVASGQTSGGLPVASDSAIELASGEFVAPFNAGDELPEHALYMFAVELNEHPEADLVYSDEDKIDGKGERRDPHFKTAWDPDLFYTRDVISHLCLYRTAIVRAIGGLRDGCEGGQYYDFALRFVERIPDSHIRHIPRILYHGRETEDAPRASAANSNAREAARNALRSHLERTGIDATVVFGQGDSLRVVYPVPAPAPPVSLIIATRDRVELLARAVVGLLEETDYEPLELIIVDNQSRDAATLKYLCDIQRDARVRVIKYDAAFNYSAINNLGVRQSSGELVGLVNNDIRVISPGWLREMVSHALRPEIGAVGAKLLYPDDTVQHAGVILGVNGVAAHAHRFFPRHSPGYAGRAVSVQNVSAVTAACMVLRRQVFDALGGLDEVNLPVAYNDVDMCMRIRAKGYRILWTPYAELYHLESASRGSDELPENATRSVEEKEYMMRAWGRLLENDPYYNPNLTAEREDFSLAVPPRVDRKW